MAKTTTVKNPPQTNEPMATMTEMAGTLICGGNLESFFRDWVNQAMTQIGHCSCDSQVQVVSNGE